MKDRNRRLAGRLILITGGAGGIGVEIARQALQEGARIVLTDLREDRVQEVAGQLGSEVYPFAHDVTRKEQWDEIAKFCRKEGGLHGLVNNAGIYDPRSIGDTDPEFFDLTQRINQLGVFLGIRMCAESAAADGASIVNVSSFSGMRGRPGIAYTASKWAVRGMSKTAAVELAPQKIRVNSIHPAFIDTPMLDPVPRDVLTARMKNIPLGRGGTVTDVAELTLFLLSDESDFITGAEIALDGGLNAG